MMEPMVAKSLDYKVLLPLEQPLALYVKRRGNCK